MWYIWFKFHFHLAKYFISQAFYFRRLSKWWWCIDDGYPMMLTFFFIVQSTHVLHIWYHVYWLNIAHVKHLLSSRPHLYLEHSRLNLLQAYLTSYISGSWLKNSCPNFNFKPRLVYWSHAYGSHVHVLSIYALISFYFMI